MPDILLKLLKRKYGGSHKNRSSIFSLLLIPQIVLSLEVLVYIRSQRRSVFNAVGYKIREDSRNDV